MAVEFRLVHASDLHFGSSSDLVPGPFEHRSATTLVRDVLSSLGLAEDDSSDEAVAWFRPATHSVRATRHFARFLSTTIVDQVNPDAVIVSGDLTSRGASDELMLAKRYLTEPPTSGWKNDSGAPVIGQLRDRLIVIPGNHDRYGERFSPGSRTFDGVFANLWQPSSGCQCVATRVFNGPKGAALLVGSIDLCLRAHGDGSPPVLGFIGTGRVYDDSLEALFRATRDFRAGNAHCAIVWVAHFPPGFEGISASLQLHEERKLLATGRDAGVSLVLCGHTHSSRHYVVDGVRVNCAGSATQASRDSDWCFSVCRILVESQGSVKCSVVEFRFDRVRENFVEGEEYVFD